MNLFATCDHCGAPGARPVQELGPLRQWVNPRYRFGALCSRCVAAYNQARARAQQQQQPQHQPETEVRNGSLWT
jgi:hypothetical protein